MIVRSPNQINNENKSLFLAGGISNCMDWQKIIEPKLDRDDLNVINPRRKDWNIDADDDESVKQIIWEYEWIKKSDYISFWFPEETLCPITLFELGSALHTKNIVAIGIHPNYKRKLDVEIQVRFIHPNIDIVYDLDSFVDTIKKNINED